MIISISIMWCFINRKLIYKFMYYMYNQLRESIIEICIKITQRPHKKSRLPWPNLETLYFSLVWYPISMMTWAPVLLQKDFLIRPNNKNCHASPPNTVTWPSISTTKWQWKSGTTYISFGFVMGWEQTLSSWNSFCSGNSIK